LYGTEARILVGGGSKIEALTIGQLARRAGVGIETVRFYERREVSTEVVEESIY